MKRTERQQHKRNHMKSRLFSIGVITVLVVAALSLFLWYLQQPPNNSSDEEAGTFLDASQQMETTSDYFTAMTPLQNEFTLEMNVINSQLENADPNSSYVFSMDFINLFDEQASKFYDIHERMSNIKPPPELENAHFYVLESVYFLYEGCVKISDGASQQDSELITQGLEDFLTSQDYNDLAQQEIEPFL